MTDSSDTAPLNIRLLGPFEVTVNGGPMPRPRSRAGQWLLALLALRHDRLTERAWVAALLWPESSHEQALFNLRRNLTDLRQALGAEANRLQSPTARTLRLDLSGAVCDVIAFDAAVQRGDSASLQEAVALYRGPLLEECSEEWLILEREARGQAYLTALETLAAMAIQEGNTHEAIGYLRRAVAADAYRETAQRALMQALAISGDRTAATLAYREFRLLLNRDLRSEPAPETQEIFRNLRRVQRSSRSLATASAPQASLPAPPLHVPQPLSALVGRVEEIRQVSDRLNGARLITLTGTGGVGKTRLAIAVAEELAGRFQNGIWFVDLAPLSDSLLVAQTVAGSLRLREEPGYSPTQSLVRALATKDLLLILDNCEHVLEECACIAHALLSECPVLHILATSRQALGLTGEVVWRVPSLPFPDEKEVLDAGDPDAALSARIWQFDASRLFLERAMESSSTFTVNAQNVSAVVRICRRLDGIPLAIELAAARVRVMPVEQIASRLDDRFRLLTGGSGAALPRQQTLRATIDWSYHLLDDQERLLLCRLAVFVGGWSLEAAEAICTVTGAGDSLTPLEVLDVLTALVDKSLVIYDEQGEQARYRMLETVRQYAEERLAERGAEERTGLRRRHRDFFLRMAEEAEAYLSGGTEQAHWFERLDRELDNFRAALEWCRSAPEETEGGIRLGAALQRYWEARGLHHEAGQRLMALLSSEREGRRTAARARALFVAAWLLEAANIVFAAAPELGIDFRPMLEEALSIYREIGDQHGVAFLQQELGYHYRSLREFATARAYLEQSLALWREIGDRKSSAAAIMGLGRVADDESDFTLARRYYEEAVAIDREYQQRAGWAISNLTRILLQLGEPAAALALLREDMINSRELENRPKILYALLSFASLAAVRGEWPRAMRLCAAWESAYENLYQKSPQTWEGIEEARQALGEEAFTAAWAEGLAMTLEQAVDEALTQTGA
jgi:non-specific serine/threonine protein kinase